MNIQMCYRVVNSNPEGYFYRSARKAIPASEYIVLIMRGLVKKNLTSRRIRSQKRSSYQIKLSIENAHKIRKIRAKSYP